VRASVDSNVLKTHIVGDGKKEARPRLSQGPAGSVAGGGGGGKSGMKDWRATLSPLAIS
jgi:hypothetical protein